MKRWLVINRYSEVIIDTDDLNYAWSVCETSARCGEALTVINNPLIEGKK